MKMQNVPSHTRKAKHLETLAKSLIRGSAAITIFILLWIVGYIVYKGLISDTRTVYSVVGKGNMTVPLDEEGMNQVVVIVHKDVRVTDLSIEMIRYFYNGEELYWLVTEQGLKVRPFAPSPDTLLGKTIKQSLLLDNEKYTSSVVFLEDDESIIRRVASTKGGIGIISKKSMGNVLVKKVKSVPVRYFSLIVNKTVLSMQENKRLNYITEKDIVNLFQSTITNWKDVGGISLPVTTVSYKANSFLGKQFQELVLNNNRPGVKSVYIDSFNEINTVLEKNKGAVCFALYLEALKKYPEQILKAERREIKPNLSLHFLMEEPAKAGKAGGISSIIINTLLMILLTLCIATPIGIGAAIYLTEYAKQGKLISVLRFFTETLAAIPSIIFGLFGYILFVNYFKWGMGLFSGSLTITIMILPTIIRTAEEAFKSVPREYREESLALGATLWKTIRRVVIPSALPGILTGIILAIGRAVGETAAVLFTLGSSPAMAKDIFSSARVLSLHLYILAKEGISFERAFATALILVVIILIVNTSATVLVGKMNYSGRK